MNDLLNLLGAERYSQHSICLTNDPFMMMLYVWGDGVTGVSYFIIGTVLLLRWHINKMRPSRRLQSLTPLYGWFIFLCGLSHFTSITTLFWGIYRLDVFVTFAMAGVSGATAYFTLLDYLGADSTEGESRAGV